MIEESLVHTLRRTRFGRDYLSTDYMTMSALFIQSKSTLSFECWLLHHHHFLNMLLLCARLYAQIHLRILQSTFHYIEFGRRTLTHESKFVNKASFHRAV